MSSPEAAAAGRSPRENVEHVALGDDASAAVRADAKAGKAGVATIPTRANEAPAKKKSGASERGAARARRACDPGGARAPGRGEVKREGGKVDALLSAAILCSDTSVLQM